MKKTLSRSICGALLSALMLVSGLYAADHSNGRKARHNRIVGVWDVEVTVLDCSTGGQLTGFRGLHKYERGGTAQVVPSTNPANLSAHVGIWRYVGKNQYELKFKMFRFDGSGNNIGWAVVKNDVQINDAATEYAGSGQADVFDSSGNSVGKSCPTFVGTRFTK